VGGLISQLAKGTASSFIVGELSNIPYNLWGLSVCSGQFVMFIISVLCVREEEYLSCLLSIFQKMRPI